MNSEYSSKYSKWRIFTEKYPEADFETLLEYFRLIFSTDEIPIVWTADKYPIKANVTDWMNALHLESYEKFYPWSDQNRILFWKKAVEALNIRFQKEYLSILEFSDNPDEMVWLKGATFNIVESCFQASSEQTSIYFKAEQDSDIKSISYQALFQKIKLYASGFRSIGIQSKDRIILYIPFSIEAVASYLALIYIGAEPVLVADSFSALELKNRMDIVRVKTILTTDFYWYADKKIDVISKVIAAAPEQIILHSIHVTDANTIRKNTNDMLLSMLEITIQNIDPYYHSSADIISILFSSGTTKEPKAIPWTATTPIKCATDGMLLQDIHEGDVVTWTSGMGWMMAPWLIFATLMNKATMALYGGAATKKAFIDFTVETHVTVLGTIPSVVKLWRSQQFGKIRNWRVRVFSSTGEPSEKEEYLYLMYMNDFKAPVIEYCGGTEIGGGYISSCVLLPNAPSYFNTPAPGGNFVLLNNDHQLVQEGEAGEVFIIPPSIGLSQRILNKNHYEEYYLNVPEITGLPALRKHGDGFAFIHSEEGIRFYKSMGRTDDSMNLGGIKISAVELEYVLNQHPLVIESAAIAIQDTGGGPEKLVVFIQPHGVITDSTLLLKELQTQIQHQLNPLFKISALVLKEVFPRTASNKLMRKDLRKEYTGK